MFLDGHRERPLTVAIYFATPEPGSHLPSQKYKDLILSGANYWHLPERYIRDILEPIQGKRNEKPIMSDLCRWMETRLRRIDLWNLGTR